MHRRNIRTARSTRPRQMLKPPGIITEYSGYAAMDHKRRHLWIAQTPASVNIPKEDSMLQISSRFLSVFHHCLDDFRELPVEIPPVQQAE